MFSNALYKQSCKANGTMWAIITFAVCFMLACVMLISGSDSIGSTITAVEDTIVNKEIDASLEKRAINYYENEVDGMQKFDSLFVENAQDAVKYHMAFAVWQSNPLGGDMPAPETDAAKVYVKNFQDWNNLKPQEKDFDSTEKYNAALSAWQEKNPVSIYGAGASAYAVACAKLQDYIYAKALALNPAYTAESNEAQEMLGSVMYAINPDGMFDDFYLSHNETVPEDYDVNSLILHYISGDVQEYLSSEERQNYIAERSEFCSAAFLAGNITLQENVDKIISELKDFGVTPEKYASFGYDYNGVKSIAANTVITFRNRLDYELEEVNAKLESGEITAEEYSVKLAQVKKELTDDIAASLLASLPEEVSSALEEVGQLDLYSLVVGSIFYKLAGLLLPIIFMIMASNNLVAGQVDSGSMAYVLSTSTKRETVVFTQAVYLISALLSMFALTTVTGCICLAIVKDKVSLAFGELILLNVGAFLVLFALSGLCFLTSCWYDRSKRSMAVGGGLSIFSLVAAMLGLFGSPVIPKVVRLDALNNFNYVTVITLFDAISIIDGTLTFLWKFAILFVLGVLGYVAGSVKFVKKDLPL